jgi:hypothetical protein
VAENGVERRVSASVGAAVLVVVEVGASDGTRDDAAIFDVGMRLGTSDFEADGDLDPPIRGTRLGMARELGVVVDPLMGERDGRSDTVFVEGLADADGTMDVAGDWGCGWDGRSDSNCAINDGTDDAVGMDWEGWSVVRTGPALVEGESDGGVVVVVAVGVGAAVVEFEGEVGAAVAFVGTAPVGGAVVLFVCRTVDGEGDVPGARVDAPTADGTTVKDGDPPLAIVGTSVPVVRTGAAAAEEGCPVGATGAATPGACGTSGIAVAVVVTVGLADGTRVALLRVLKNVVGAAVAAGATKDGGPEERTGDRAGESAYGAAVGLYLSRMPRFPTPPPVLLLLVVLEAFSLLSFLPLLLLPPPPLLLVPFLSRHSACNLADG